MAVVDTTINSATTILAKSAGVSGIEVGIGNATYQGIYVDLTTGAITDSSAAYSATSTSLGDGWWSITFTGSRASDTGQVWFGCSQSNNPFFTGNGVDGILLCRPQVEYGTVATAYQRVTTATDYDAVGFPMYLKADGVDDGMATGSVDFTATDKMSVFAGLQKLSDAALGVVAELSADSNSNLRAFRLDAPGSPTTRSFQVQSLGTLQVNTNITGYSAPTTKVVTGQFDIGGDVCRLRLNGAFASESLGDQGTGNYGNYPLYLLRRGGASLPFNGNLHQLIVLGRTATADEITKTESFIATKTGITI
jgi:hypothetical protein